MYKGPKIQSGCLGEEEILQKCRKRHISYCKFKAVIKKVVKGKLNASKLLHYSVKMPGFKDLRS